MDEFQDIVPDGIDDYQMDDFNTTGDNDSFDIPQKVGFGSDVDGNDPFDGPQEIGFGSDVDDFLNSKSILGSSVI